MKSIYKFLSEKIDKNRVPLKPYDIAQWCKTEGGRPITEANLLSIAGTIKSRVGNLDDHVVYVPTSALVMDQIFSQEIAKATVTGLDDYNAYVLKFGTQMMVGLAINAINWDYSAIRFYNQASSVEVKDGFTADFASKHISGTDNAKSARSVAKERLKEVEDKSVPALGKIVTTRSGAISKQDIGAFSKEILSRQKEFTTTHKRLTDHVGENWLMTMAQGDTFQYIDGVTFRTKSTYSMFEFEQGKGGDEGEYYIDFSLSADSTGSGWAVHHLAGARTDTIIPNAKAAINTTLGQERGEPALEPTSYMNNNPFQGGRKPPSLG